MSNWCNYEATHASCVKVLTVVGGTALLSLAIVELGGGIADLFEHF